MFLTLIKSIILTLISSIALATYVAVNSNSNNKLRLIFSDFRQTTNTDFINKYVINNNPLNISQALTIETASTRDILEYINNNKNEITDSDFRADLMSVNFINKLNRHKLLISSVSVVTFVVTLIMNVNNILL